MPCSGSSSNAPIDFRQTHLHKKNFIPANQLIFKRGACRLCKLRKMFSSQFLLTTKTVTVKSFGDLKAICLLFKDKGWGDGDKSWLIRIYGFMKIFFFLLTSGSCKNVVFSSFVILTFAHIIHCSIHWLYQNCAWVHCERKKCHP